MGHIKDAEGARNIEEYKVVLRDPLYCPALEVSKTVLFIVLN